MAQWSQTDDYERNKILIDLTCQPQEIKDKVDSTIKETLKLDHVPQVGVHFMRLCGKYELKKIADQSDAYAKWLNSTYSGVLRESL